MQKSCFCPVSAGGESPNIAYTVKRFLVIKYEDEGNGIKHSCSGKTAPR